MKELILSISDTTPSRSTTPRMGLLISNNSIQPLMILRASYCVDMSAPCGIRLLWFILNLFIQIITSGAQGKRYRGRFISRELVENWSRIDREFVENWSRIKLFSIVIGFVVVKWLFIGVKKIRVKKLNFGPEFSTSTLWHGSFFAIFETREKTIVFRA